MNREIRYFIVVATFVACLAADAKAQKKGTFNLEAEGIKNLINYLSSYLIYETINNANNVSFFYYFHYVSFRVIVLDLYVHYLLCLLYI